MNYHKQQNPGEGQHITTLFWTIIMVEWRLPTSQMIQNTAI